MHKLADKYTLLLEIIKKLVMMYNESVIYGQMKARGDTFVLFIDKFCLHIYNLYITMINILIHKNFK